MQQWSENKQTTSGIFRQKIKYELTERYNTKMLFKIELALAKLAGIRGTSNAFWSAAAVDVMPGKACSSFVSRFVIKPDVDIDARTKHHNVLKQLQYTRLAVLKRRNTL